MNRLYILNTYFKSFLRQTRWNSFNIWLTHYRPELVESSIITPIFMDSSSIVSIVLNWWPMCPCGLQVPIMGLVAQTWTTALWFRIIDLDTDANMNEEKCCQRPLRYSTHCLWDIKHLKNVLEVNLAKINTYYIIFVFNCVITNSIGNLPLIMGKYTVYMQYKYVNCWILSSTLSFFHFPGHCWRTTAPAFIITLNRRTKFLLNLHQLCALYL